MKSVKGLSGAALKHIALITMLMDHINKAILVYCLAADAPAFLTALINSFGALGRFAFPIFSFLLVEGFFHTRSRMKHLRNLIVFALISEIPFNLFLSASIRAASHQNIFFTLAIAFGLIWAVEETKAGTAHWKPFALLYLLGASWLASALSTDYGALGILAPFLFYLLRARPLAASLIAFLPLWSTPWALGGFLLTNLYNGERGRQCKWLNYWIYPLHLLSLGLARFFFL